MTGNLMLYHNN